MAEQIGGRSPVRRQTAPARKRFLAEAAATERFVRELLTSSFAGAPWIEQIAFAAGSAVQMGIENFGGSTLSHNAAPGDPYRHQARSREELLATEHLAADSRSVGAREAPREAVAPVSRAAGPQTQAPSPPKASGDAWTL